jgi:hypothetical protein
LEDADNEEYFGRKKKKNWKRRKNNNNLQIRIRGRERRECGRQEIFVIYLTFFPCITKYQMIVFA